MLDREQLALASLEERDRALENERKWAARESADTARENALSGDPVAVRALRRKFLPLVRDDA